MLPLQEVGTSVESLGTLVKLVEEHGTLVVFAVASGLTNAYLILQIITGKLVPYSMYKEAVDELTRLRKAMEGEHKAIWAKVLKFMGGLKVDTKEVSEDATTNRSSS